MTREQKRAMWRRSAAKQRAKDPAAYNKRKRDSMRRHRAANPERAALTRQARVDRELLAPGEHSEAQWGLKLLEFDKKCAYCGAEGDMQRDHLVPLVDGGTNAIGNIVPACPSCNTAKGGKSGKDLLTWITGRCA